MPQDMTIAKNLRSIMYKKGVSQAELARAMNINKASLSSWMNGTRIPRMPNIDMLAEHLGVSREDIVGKTPDTSTNKSVRIKVYGRVAAGIPMEMIEDVYDEEEIPVDWTRGGKEYFGLVIHGDSMLPRMSEGDVIIVRKQPDAENGETVVATINGFAATCKVLRKTANGIELCPTNPSHEIQSYRRLVNRLYREMNLFMGAKVYRNQIVEEAIDPDFVPYLFRHTYCTDLKKKGVDIRIAKNLMGHADIKTTANIYDHDDGETLMLAAKQMGLDNTSDNT